MTFYIEIGHFPENLDSMTFEAKMPCYAKCDIWIIQHYQTCDIKGEISTPETPFTQAYNV